MPVDIERTSSLPREAKASDFMPNTPSALAVLKNRALLLAAHVNEQEVEHTNDFIKFSNGGKEYYGVPYQYIKEIIPNAVLTELPSAPSYVAGIINWRGKLISVVDLVKFFNNKTKTVNGKNNAYVLIVESKKTIIAILAENLEDGKGYSDNSLQPPLATSTKVVARYIIGLHEGITAILNIENIITDMVKG